MKRKRIGLFVQLVLISVECSVFSGCTNTAYVWQRAKQIGSKDAYIDFLYKYRHSEFTDDAIKALEEYATYEDTLTILEFADYSRDLPNTLSHVDLSILELSDEHSYRVTGKSKSTWLCDSTNIFKKISSTSGSKITLLGTLRVGTYLLSSDAQNPLVFRKVADKGYVYIKGEGLIVNPEKQVIILGRKKYPGKQ